MGEEKVMEEVVVTATKTKVPLRELGVSATLITSEDMERSQTTDVRDLLRNVAGLNVSENGGRGGLTQVFPRGGEANFTQVLIDGVKVNNAGGEFDFAKLTTDNVERIEIIRGPQSALYGADAIGGVIQIFTKKGEGKPTARISTANGAHSENGNYMGEQKFSIAGGNELTGFSFAYGRIDDNGILDVNDDYWNNTFSGRMDLYPSEDCDIYLTARVEDIHRDFPTENGGDKFSPLDPDQSQKERDIAMGLGTCFDIFDWWENAFQFSFHQNTLRFDDPFNPGIDYSDFFSDTEEQRTTVDYHVNLRYPQQGQYRSTFTLGYAYEFEKLDQASTSGGVASTLKKNRYTNSFYGQEQISLFGRLHLTGGVRVDDHSLFGTEVNPRGSIALDIVQTGTTLRGAIGTGFKQPTFTENFFQSPFATGNPELHPEKSFSWEVGLEQYLFDNRLQCGVTYFYNKFDDLIVFDYFSSPNFQNIQEAKTQGVEVSTTVKPGYGLTLAGQYTYLDTEVTDDGGLGGPDAPFTEGKELLRRPKHSASMVVDWQWEGFKINVGGNYVGKRDDMKYVGFTATRVTNDDHFLLDLAMAYTFDVQPVWLKGVKIFAKGNNILDEKYEDVVGFSSARFSAMGGIEVGI
jgi:vitamin B12 transporter